MDHTDRKLLIIFIFLVLFKEEVWFEEFKKSVGLDFITFIENSDPNIPQ